MDRNLHDNTEQELVGASPPAGDLVAGAVLRGSRMRRRRRLSVGNSAVAFVLAATSAVAMLGLPSASRADAPAATGTTPVMVTTAIDSKEIASTRKHHEGGKIFVIIEQISDCDTPPDDTPSPPPPEFISVALPAAMTAQQRDAVAAAVRASPLLDSVRSEEGSDIPERFRRLFLYPAPHGRVEMVVRFVVSLKDPSTAQPLADELQAVGDVGKVFYGSCAQPTGAVAP